MYQNELVILFISLFIQYVYALLTNFCNAMESSDDIKLSVLIKANGTVGRLKSPAWILKVNKNENLFGFDFEFCTVSLLVMLKYEGFVKKFF